MLGAAAASSSSSRKEPAARKRPGKSKQKPSTVSKGRNRHSTNDVAAMIGGSSARSRVTSAPVQLGMVRYNSNRRPRFTVPFNMQTIQVQTNATPALTFQNLVSTNVQLAAGGFALQVQGGGTGNFIGFISSTFMSLTKSLERWRIRRMKVCYIPLQPTSVAGNIVLAASPDAALVGSSSSTSYSDISSISGAWSFPIWQANEHDITPYLDPTWKAVVSDTSPTTDAEMREVACGCLYGQFLGVPASTACGVLSFEGEIEFEGIRIASAA